MTPSGVGHAIVHNKGRETCAIKNLDSKAEDKNLMEKEEVSMTKSALVTAIILNSLLLAGITQQVIDNVPTDPRGWILLDVFLSCPIMNLAGLSGIVGRLATVLIMVFNGAAVLS